MSDNQSPDSSPQDTMGLPGAATGAEAPTLGGESVEVPPPLPQFTSLAGYEVLGELGRGGMGVVYKARQLNLNRIVALKMVLAGDHASPDELVRFLGEGEAIAHLKHPNIVQIHEIGRHNNLPYFCLEYVAGGPLNRQLHGQPQPPRSAAQLIVTLARTIHFAHEHGIVHRDLKPANILLDASGTPKLTDFGLARRVQGSSGLTQTGAVLGTPSYMCPEQAQGRKDIGPATDIYALGAILYELLTGRPPFLAATPLDTLFQVLHQEPVPPMQLQPGLPRDLNTICLKCLHKEPARRYATAQDLADDLERFLQDLPIQARPVGTLERTGRWCRRNPLVAGMAGSVILLLLTLAVGASLVAWRLDRERRIALASEERARTSEEHALAEEREKTDRLWQSLLDRARAGRFSRQAGQRFAGLEALGRAAAVRSSPELRDEAIALLALTDLRPARQGEEGREAGQPGAVEGGPTQLAADSDDDGTIRVWRRWDGRELARLPNRRGPIVWHVTRFSPDGRFLAVWYFANTADAIRVAVWDWQAKRTVVESAGTVSGGAFNWDPASKQLAVGWPDGTIHFFDPLTGKEVHQFASGVVPDQLVIDSAGKRVAVSSAHQNNVVVFDRATGRRLAAWAHPSSVRGVAFSPDGRWLATGCDDANGYIWDLDKGKQHTVLRGHNRSVIRLAFHPSGRLLASDGWDGRLWLWDPYDGRGLVTTAGTLAGPFSADGAWLPTRAGLYRVADGEEWCRVPVETVNRICDVSFHPEGRCLAVAGSEGVSLWDVRNRRPAGRVAVGWGAAIFHPADSRLITFGNRGLLCYPTSMSDGALVFGPPRSLGHPTPSMMTFHLDASRGGVAVADYGRQQSLFWPAGREAVPQTLADRNATTLALHPEGRFIVTGSSYAYGLKVHDASGHLVKSLEAGNAAARFSPDGRLLAGCTSSHVCLWRCEDWGLILQRPRDQAGTLDVNGIVVPPVFSPDGQFLAYSYSSHEVRLLRVADGAVLAVLESPDPRLVGSLAVSSDGRFLAVGTDNGAQVWDLFALSRGLQGLGLQPDLPGVPLTPAATVSPLLVRIHEEPTVGPATAVTRPQRKATAEAIAAWVQEVKDGKPGQAGQALEEVGPPALPALADALVRLDGPARSRLSSLHARIAGNDRLDPTRVRLRFNQKPIADAVAELSHEGKIPVRVAASVPASTRVSLEVENVPFWEALDRLCRQAGLGWSREGDGFIVTPGSVPAGSALAYAGPIRLRVLRSAVLSDRDLQGPGSGMDWLEVSCQVQGEPRLGELWVRRLRVVEALDQSDQSLAPGWTYVPSLFGPYEPGRSPLELAVVLKAPEGRAGALRRLGLALPVQIEVPVRRVVDADLANAGQTYPLPDGGRLTVHGVREEGSVVHVEVEVRERPPHSHDRELRFDILDEKGREYRRLAAGFPRLAPERELIWLAAPLQPPWSALALHAGRDRTPPGRTTLRFERGQDRGVPRRLVLSCILTESRDLTFTFNDLPLP